MFPNPNGGSNFRGGWPLQPAGRGMGLPFPMMPPAGQQVNMNPFMHQQPQLPWNRCEGDDRGAYRGRDRFKPVADECGICAADHEVNFLYQPCKHYPFCAECTQKQSLNTPGMLKCPHCRKQVTEVHEVQKVMIVKSSSTTAASAASTSAQ